MRLTHPVIRTTALAVPLVLALGARHGAADPLVYYHAGAWQAFTDKDSSGKDICGIDTTNPNDGRDFSLTYLIGGENLTFRATKPSWTVPDGTQLNVSMQIDQNTPWPAEALGHGTSVEWAVGAASVQAFDGLFRAGSTLTLTFPSGNEAPWTLSLSGSTAASQTLWRCVEDMSVRDHVVSPANNTPPSTQPYAPPDASNTQPGPAPTAPTPTQPTMTPAAPPTSPAPAPTSPAPATQP
ncbi:MAG TPA: hypothetical protein VK726_21455 [Acetobacteraceae bacterium]|jgi:hypothetical protein|nr:hypothetical protein [Acetobacteraceae bacterium]